MLGAVANAATETSSSARTVLGASQAVEASVSDLRTEVEKFLAQVAA